MSHLTVDDLEKLFLDKLQEKYKLNERDLKKAFSGFDTNQNGLLEVDEIGGLVNQILNGISAGQIQALLDRFDVNGDGQITYEEFLAYLLERKDAMERNIGRRSMPTNRKEDNRPSSRARNQPQPAGRASGSGPNSGQGIGPYGDDDEMDNNNQRGGNVSNRAVAMHRRQREPPRDTGGRGKPYYAEDDEVNEDDDDDNDDGDDYDDDEEEDECDDRYRGGGGGGRGGPPQSQRRQQVSPQYPFLTTLIPSITHPLTRPLTHLI